MSKKKSADKPTDVVSAYRLYRRTIPTLGRMHQRWKELFDGCPKEDTGQHAFLTELGLKITKEVRETLKADVDLRIKTHELRKLDMLDQETDEVERLLARYTRRRGLLPVENIREAAVRALVDAGQPEDAARAFVDGIIPEPEEYPERVNLYQSYRRAEERLADDIDRGTELLRETLGDVEGPPEDVDGQDQDNHGETDGTHTDDSVSDGEVLH